MNTDEIAKTLDLHYKWLRGETEGVQANLTGADLSGADLSMAILTEANLSRANLYGANLSRANLSRANLDGANLYGATLSRANLDGADLPGANLSGAILTEANLSRANLYGANLSRANLDGADLTDIYLPVAQLPEGTLRGYKKLRGGVICTLEIPKEAKRSSATTNKCRAEYAIPIAFSDGSTTGKSLHDPSFVYRLNEIARPDGFDDNRWNECAPGIHFFLTKEEAEAYNY